MALVVSLSNHEQPRSSFDRYILSETLILRQAQDERRVEGLRTSACARPSDPPHYSRTAHRCSTQRATVAGQASQRRLAPVRGHPPGYETSVSRDLEVAPGPTLTPRTPDRAVGRPDVLQSTLGGDVDRIAGRVPGIRLDSHGPARGIHGDARDRNGIGSRVDDARDILAIPVHHEREVMPLGRSRTPITRPRTRQRVSFLGERGHDEAQPRKNAHEIEDSSQQAKPYQLRLAERVNAASAGGFITRAGGRERAPAGAQTPVP
jgi:hypothetical protein